MKRIYNTIFFILLLQAAAQAQWTQVTKFGGGKADGCFSFSLDGKGYVGGGSPEMWEYDPASSKWTARGDNPGLFMRAFSFSFTVNGKAYVGGGDSAYVLSKPLNDVWMYNPATMKWTKKNNFPVGYRAGAFSFVIDNVAYVGGGVEPAGLWDDVYKYDDVNDTWTQVSSLPYPGIGGLYGAASFALNGKGYIVGGSFSNGSASGNAKFVYEYDPKNDQWTQKKDFPGSIRAFTFSFVLDGKAYVGGGSTNASVTHQDFYRYDAAADSWTKLQDLPTDKTCWATSFVIGDAAYLTTGAHVTAMSLDMTDETYQYKQPVSVKDVMKENNAITIYPNPAGDVIRIKVLPQDEAELTITNMLGEMVITETHYKGGEVDISKLSGGLYLATLRAGGAVQYGRFAKD